MVESLTPKMKSKRNLKQKKKRLLMLQRKNNPRMLNPLQALIALSLRVKKKREMMALYLQKM